MLFSFFPDFRNSSDIGGDLVNFLGSIFFLLSRNSKPIQLHVYLALFSSCSCITKGNSNGCISIKMLNRLDVDCWTLARRCISK